MDYIKFNITAFVLILLLQEYKNGLFGDIQHRSARLFTNRRKLSVHGLFRPRWDVNSHLIKQQQTQLWLRGVIQWNCNPMEVNKWEIRTTGTIFYKTTLIAQYKHAICTNSAISLLDGHRQWPLTYHPTDKWPPFRRRHFQMHLHEWKAFYFELNFTEVYS